MSKLENTRGTVHRRVDPLLKPVTGRMEAIRNPPTEAYRELAKAGLLPVTGPRLHSGWCQCSHQDGAHPDGGPCQAKACVKFGGCQGYVQDPRYLIDGPTGNVVVGKGRITSSPSDDPGKVRLHFERGEAEP